jgi:hypothetical protein
MTQPSLTTTFDTSLIDLAANHSFSTTESLPSEKDFKLDNQRSDEPASASSVVEVYARDVPIIMIVKGDKCLQRIPQFVTLTKQRANKDGIRVAILDEETNDDLKNRVNQCLLESASVVSIQLRSNNSQIMPSTSNNCFDGLLTIFKPGKLSLNTYFTALRTRINPSGVVLLNLSSERYLESSHLGIRRSKRVKKNANQENETMKDIEAGIELAGFQFLENDDLN